MGVVINHAIGFVTSPFSVGLALVALGLVVGRKWRRVGMSVIVGGLVWLYCMSTGWMYLLLGLGLERQFPPQRVEELPAADAIVVLGGGVGGSTNVLFYTEMFAGADRVAHAARVWKAGKAPVVIPSGANELQAARPLLMEFGVPESAILVENESRNTEENARFVATYVKQHHEQNVANSAVHLHTSPSPLSQPQPSPQPKILLVTSAWHMRRALYMFKKYAPGVEVVPAACDYEATLFMDWAELSDYVLPNAGSLMANSAMLKEYVGYVGYRVLR